MSNTRFKYKFYLHQAMFSFKILCHMQNKQLTNELFLSNRRLHSLEFNQSKDNSLMNKTHQQNTL